MFKFSIEKTRSTVNISVMSGIFARKINSEVKTTFKYLILFYSYISC